MKKIIALILLSLGLLAVAFAQDTATTVSAASGSDLITDFITSLASKYPWVVTIASVIGVLRLCFKPIMTGIEAWVKSTPSTADDEIFEKVEHSPAFSIFAWCLDFVGSVKIGPRFTAKPEAKPVQDNS
jgi:hypothetical protein